MEDNKQEIKEKVVRKFNIKKKEILEESIKDNNFKAIIDAILAGELAVGAVGLTVRSFSSTPADFLLTLIANIPAVLSIIFIKRMIQAIMRKCGDERELQKLYDQDYLQILIEDEKNKINETDKENEGKEERRL